MLDHDGQISIPSTVARGLVYVSAVVSYSMAYDFPVVTDTDNLATELSAQIQISIALIGIVRKLSIESIVLAKRWGITPEKLRRLFKPQHREGLRLCSNLHCQDSSQKITGIFIIVAWHILFSHMMFASTVSRRGNRFAQVYDTYIGWAGLS